MMMNTVVASPSSRLINTFTLFLLLAPLWSGLGSISVVQAQLLVRVPGLPACAEGCADQAAFVSLCIPTTAKCLCGPTESFSSATLECAVGLCTQPEQVTVEKALANFCPAEVTTSFITSFITITSTSSTSSSAVITPTPTPTPSTTVTPESTTFVIQTFTAIPTNAAVPARGALLGVENGGRMGLVMCAVALIFGVFVVL